MLKENTCSSEAIAIIGMSGIFPQAPDIKAFWRNILAGVDAISEPLPEWEAERYLESGRIDTARGGYLKDLYRFDPRRFGVMPKSVDGCEPDQLLALRVACDALQDSGYLDGDYNHHDTGIVLGHSTYLHRAQANHIQHHIILDQTIELLRGLFPDFDDSKASRIRKILEGKLPHSSADNAPGMVPNVMTGRIANRLDLRGPNYIIDAACSSSLLAVGAAVDELRSGCSRMMLAGGVNASIPAEASVIFTQLGALSKSGKIRSFGEDCDGTLLGEGLGIVVLKRLSDAIADGNRIYAVIRGVGVASDGKALGLLAPNIEGETLAIERAYATSGIDPATVELIEAHGTGIPLGDKTEIAALRKTLGARIGAQGSVALGTIKSMIGHTIPAAGIAGLIKCALALHHKILPPTICDAINPELEIENTPLYINTTARPWIARPGSPRRAGINAFGFGGINTHAILEEAPAQSSKPLSLASWPFELCVFSGSDSDALTQKLNSAAKLLIADRDYQLSDIAAELAAQDTDGPIRIAMVAKDSEDLAAKIAQALKRLKGNAGERWATRNGLVYSSRPLEGKLAFMFPGEGSQYLHMIADLALYFDEVRSWFDFWRGLYNDPPGESRTDIIFPPLSELTEQRRQVLGKRIHDMDVGSEAVFVGGQAMYSLLKSLGVQPDAMVGHSTGESSALAASGAMAYDNLEQLADFIRQLNQVYRGVLEEGKIPTGVLLSVGALPQSVIEEQLAALNKEIVIAMDNCSNQLVLFGDQASIDALQKSLGAAGGICMPLPFDRGYHTVHFSAMSNAFLDYYKHIGLERPRIPLYSCASADLFPDDVAQVRKLAAGQWSLKVRFRETVTQMYRQGVRYFVEVGPAGNLCAFIHDILSGKEYLAVASDLRRKNSVEQLLTLLAHLYVNGKELKLERLFSSRSIAALDLEKGLKDNPLSMPLLDNTMPVIHLSEADRAVLQKMLLQGEATEQDTRQRSALPDSKPQIHQFDASLDASNADEQVMAEYFNLMREFIDQQRRVLELSGMSAEIQSEDVTPAAAPAPFLSSLTESDEQHLAGTCRLCVYEDNFLRDHILSGTVSEIDPDLLGLSCVPLMVSLEIMAEACALLAGSTAVRVIENVKASAWIALDDGELTLNVRAEVLDPATGKFRAYLMNDGVIAATADFAFAGDWHASALPLLTEKQDLRWEDHELYDIGMFHGPIFQSIRRIGGWNGQGIDADLSSASLEGFFESNVTPKLVLNPVLLDAIGQLSAYWIAQQVGTDFNCFPSTIERIELYRQCPQDMAGMTLRARQQPIDPAAGNIDAPRLWQFECLDKEGQPLFRVSNLVNIYFAVPNRFYAVRRDPLNGWLGHSIETSANQYITLWQLPNLSDEFCSQSSGIFLRILAQIFLSFEERAEWRNLTINNRRKRQWLLGRACIKEAVRYWIFQQTGTLLYSSDIVVLHDEMGAPYVDGWWNGDLLQAPQVSLSHTAQLSLAAVTAPHHPVGVDVEHIGGVKHSDLLEGSLTETERAALHGLNGNDVSEKVLRMWCAKEAAAKYLGTGLKGRPDEFEVSFLDDSGKRVHVTHNQKMVEVAVDCDNNSIIALASAHSA